MTPEQPKATPAFLRQIVADVKADPNCPHCKGSGYVVGSSPRKHCHCTLKAQALAYLTPTYADAKYVKSLDARPLEGKSILLAGTSQANYKSIIKSYLLNTGMTRQHRTVTGYDVMQAYLTNSDSNEFSALARVDFLVLYLSYDPHNRSYNNVLSSLLERRINDRKETWIYTPHRLMDASFTNLYTSEFAQYVKERFVELNLQHSRAR